MFCPICGKQLEDGSHFCSNCGTKLDFTISTETTRNVITDNNIKNVSSIQKSNDKDSSFVTDGDTVIENDTNATDQEVHDNKDTLSNNIDDIPIQKEGIRSIYLIDFLIRLLKLSNIPLMIYLLLNVVIIGSFSAYIFKLPFQWGLLTGLLFYIASLSISLSPLGEWLIRRQVKCRKIKDRDTVERLSPLFFNVYKKARLKDPTLSPDIRMFINNDDEPNAFATGRETICLTKGLLTLSDQEIEATLAHEFGHLAHKDTDRILVITVGNFLVYGIIIIVRIILLIIEICFHIAAALIGSTLAQTLYSYFDKLFTMVVINLIVKIWNGIGTLFCMKTSRANEFEADYFATEIGYGEGLISLLKTLPDYRLSGLFENLKSTHPDSDIRIEKIAIHLDEMEGLING